MTAPGTSIKDLGSGAEGVATIVMGAADRPDLVAVRKAYSPEGDIYVPGQEDLKVQVGEVLRGDPNFAEIYTKNKARNTPGGVKYMIKEFVQGKPIDKVTQSDPVWMQNAQRAFRYGGGNPYAKENDVVDRVRKKLKRTLDVRDFDRNVGNTVLLPDGRGKVIDFIVDDLDALQRLGQRRYYPNMPGLFAPVKPLDKNKVRNVKKSFGSGGPGSRQERKVPGQRDETAGRILKLQIEKREAAAREAAERARSRAAGESVEEHARAVKAARIRRALGYAAGSLATGTGLGLGAAHLRGRQERPPQQMGV